MNKENLRKITKDACENTKDEKYQPHYHVRDVNSHTIFDNHFLTCQFLKEYTGISVFSDIQPEDIEDVTERYKAFLGVEFDTDTVKKIRIHQNGQDQDIYIISMIEHKSYVDYDIAMQLLRYMVVIWHDYKTTQNKIKEGASSRKGFRYPLIIPIVYYEGKEKWTADMQLLDRIECGEMMKEYVPDFRYKVVRLHDYTNEKLQEMNNEMSVVMLINKIQNDQDYSEFLKITESYMGTIYRNSPAEVKRIYQDIFWALLMKMKVPKDEAQKLVEDLGVRGMGYLFENLKGIDIQAERKKAAEERKKYEEAHRQYVEKKQQYEEVHRQYEEQKQQYEEQKQQYEEQKQQYEEQKQQYEEEHKKVEAATEAMIRMCKDAGRTKEETVRQLMDVFTLTEEKAEKTVACYW